MSSRVAIVTGGAQGIGKAIALKFVENGIAVVIADSHRAGGRDTERSLRRIGEALFIPTDVSREMSVRRLVDSTIKRFGGLDVLVNNAALKDMTPLADLTFARWNKVLQTNVGGYFLCAKYAAPHLKKSRGTIVNISSTRAFMAEPFGEAYAASKGAITALSQTLAISLGPQVRVNCICPGWIDVSDWKAPGENDEEKVTAKDHANHPAGRVGFPTDVAALAYFLSNPENGFITGGNFVIDGGMIRKMVY